MEMAKQKFKKNYHKERNVVEMCGPEKGRLVAFVRQRESERERDIVNY